MINHPNLFDVHNFKNNYVNWIRKFSNTVHRFEKNKFVNMRKCIEELKRHRMLYHEETECGIANIVF